MMTKTPIELNFRPKKYSMRNLMLLLILVSISALQAQNHPLEIKEWNVFPTIRMSTVENEDLIQRYQNKEDYNKKMQFAHSFESDIHITDFSVLKRENQSFWGLNVESKGAYSLNFGFERLNIPSHSALYLYSHSSNQWHGPFKKDKEDLMEYWTPIINGDRVSIVIQSSSDNSNEIELNLKTINHDYLNVQAMLSGSCNIDVVCGASDGYPEIEDWREMIRSVARYTIRGSSFCSGALINTVEPSCTPYFLTANHCVSTESAAQSLVFYWNYENSFCREPNTSDSGARGDGALDQISRGSRLVSTNSQSDFTLVQLNETLDPEVKAYLSGWDNRRVPSERSVCIHHPRGDEKRISFDLSESIIMGSSGPDVDGHFLQVDDWEKGTTEGGSSGSPLYNEDQRIVGQLFGGTASCQNTAGYDVYGFMASSFFEGADSTARLFEHLNSKNLDLINLDGVEYDAICPGDELPFEILHNHVCQNDTVRIQVELGNRDFRSQIRREQPSMKVDYDEGRGIFSIYNFNDAADPLYYFEIYETNNGSEELIFTAPFYIIDAPESVKFIERGSMEVPNEFTVRWESSPFADAYMYRYGYQEDLDAIPFDTTTETQLSLSNVQTGQLLYFEIVAINDCGNSLAQVKTFKVLDLRCYMDTINPLTPILSLNEHEVALELAELDTLRYFEINSLNIQHTYIGDLEIELHSNIDDLTISDFDDCAEEDDIRTGWKDEASMRNTCDVTLDEMYQPESPFALLYSRAKIERLSLVVKDNNDGDEGLIRSIAYQYCYVNNTTSFTNGSFRDSLYVGDSLEILLEINNDHLDSIRLVTEGMDAFEDSRSPDFFIDGEAIVTLKSDNTDAGVYDIRFILDDSGIRDTIIGEIHVLECPAAASELRPIDTLRKYYHDFSWSDNQADSYQITISTDTILQNGIVIEQVELESNHHRSGVLPNQQTLYWSVESHYSCDTIRSEWQAFYTDYHYDLKLDTSDVQLCLNHPMHVELEIGTSWFDSLSIYHVGNSVGIIEWNYDTTALWSDNKLILSLNATDLAQLDEEYTFEIYVSDNYLFTESVTLTATVIEPPVVLEIIRPDTRDTAWNFNLEHFTWVSDQDVTIELSLDSTFSAIEYSLDLEAETDSIRLFGLLFNQKHFWRIAYEGECGTQYSDFQSFTTFMRVSTVEERSSLVKIFPNPVNDQLYIHSTTEVEKISVELLDVTGRSRIRLHRLEPDDEHTLDISGLSSGLYFLKIQHRDRIQYIKIKKL